MIQIHKSAIISLIAILSLIGWTGAAQAQSGQRAFGQVSVEPAVNSADGSTIFLLTPINAPFPSKANPIHAVAPLYLVLYPTTSTKIDPATLNCQPHNCDHLNVLPFPSPDYGALPGTNSLCVTYNGGAPCSPVLGHDHLVGVPPTGDFNVAWAVKLVVFTSKGFAENKINTLVETLAQIHALALAGDVVILDTPVTFNCSITSERTWDKGTPLSF
jgi:hypothetical protein